MLWFLTMGLMVGILVGALSWFVLRRWRRIAVGGADQVWLRWLPLALAISVVPLTVWGLEQWAATQEQEPHER